VRNFLQKSRDVEVAPPQSVLDSPLKSLQQSLDALEERRSVISQKVQEVSETLTRVKEIHASVKAGYNNATAHTSPVYPEVRLSYKQEVIILEMVLNYSKQLSFPKSLLWKRDTRTGTSNFGDLAWTPLRFSWIQSPRYGGTTERSLV